jgi:hypothetical protein
MSAISGVAWDEAWADRVTGKFGRSEVAFIGRESFLKNKRAAARPKDLADIDACKKASDGCVSRAGTRAWQNAKTCPPGWRGV